MQRHEMIEAMRCLGLRGMAGAFDEAVTTGLQRKRTTHEILTDLLRAEAAHRHAASIRYRMTAAKLPVVKDLDAFVFEGTPINEGLVRSLHAGSFIPARRNIVLIGGTGTGKTHLATAITASVVCAGARGRYFNTSTSSPGSRRRPASARPAPWLPSSAGSTSWSSTNWATCRSPARAGSCCST
jgi:DNA replication protein DnaC